MIRPPPSSTLFPYTTPSDLLRHDRLSHRLRLRPDGTHRGDDAHPPILDALRQHDQPGGDRKSTRLNSSHQIISYAVFCLKKKKLWNAARTVATSTKHTHSLS